MSFERDTKRSKVSQTESSSAMRFLEDYIDKVTEDIDKENVRNALNKNLKTDGVESLAELKEKFDDKVFLNLVNSILKWEMVMDIWGKLTEELQKDQQNLVEEKLKGKTLGTEVLGLPDHTTNPRWQTTDNSFHTARDGPLPAILVLGSSGSGKTTFAAKVLPYRLKTDFENNDILTVCMQGMKVRPTMNAEDAVQEVVKKIKEEVCRIIAKAVGQTSYTPKEGSALRIFMVVVIDEVGLKFDKKWLGAGHMLRRITSELHSIAKKVQLVLVGTGLDQITESVNSDQKSRIVRMQPWKQDDM